jgi:uncharacterized protein (TIGR03437 family)
MATKQDGRTIRRLSGAILLCFFAGAAPLRPGLSQMSPKAKERSFPADVQERYRALPLHFEPNLGQSDARVLYLARAENSATFFLRREVVISRGGRIIRIRTGASAKPDVEGLDLLPGRTNHLVGADPAKWRTGVPQYRRLRYRDIYPGIDLVFHGAQGRLEYDFVAGRGADISAIRVTFDGVDEVSLAATGQLMVGKFGGISQPPPFVYQLRHGTRRAVSCKYRVLGKRTVGFALGRYDRSEPVVIDPVLVYSTFLTAPNDAPLSLPKLALDNSGNVYVAGSTTSSQFPVTANAYSGQYHGSGDGFVAKLDTSGTKLIFATYFGGSGTDSPSALALDSAGNVYVAGSTSSADLPVTPGAFQTQVGGNSSVGFILKLNPSGATLFYSTYFGADGIAALAIDASGNAYIAGAATAGLPVTASAFQARNGGSSDAFVAKLAPDGRGLIYATYLGGSGIDSANAVAVDQSNNVYVVGHTLSVDFPVTKGAFQTAFTGGGSSGGQMGNAFVAKLNSSGNGLVYATYLGGGGGTNVASAIAIDAAGNAYVTGETSSPAFPITAGAFQPLYRGRDEPGSSNAFVAKLNASGSGLVYSTYLGGSGSGTFHQATGDTASSIAIDDSGRAYVGGYSTSLDFPLAHALQTECGSWCTYQVPSGSAFVAELNSDGSSLLFSTFLGSIGQKMYSDVATALAIDGSGEVYVAGTTIAGDFPVTPGAFQTTFIPDPKIAGRITFVAKIDPNGVPQVSTSGVVNAASYLPGPVAPGELISIFGVGLGPIHGAGAGLADGLFPNALKDTTVSFDGIAAPLLYTQAGQINAIVPFAVSGRASTQMIISFAGSASARLELPVAVSRPGIFLVGGDPWTQGLILNQDGTLNSLTNPAPKKSIIVFYVVGAGIMSPAQADGAITPLSPPWPAPLQKVAVTIGGVPARINYAGAAPGLVAGVLQVNVEVPETAVAGSTVLLSLVVGASTAEVTLAVQ